MNSEKTGRLFVSGGGGELSSAGDEAGDDGVGASEKVGAEGCGLELGGAELTRVGDGEHAVGGGFEASVVAGAGSVSASSTRLRFAGGSASQSGRFACRE